MSQVRGEPRINDLIVDEVRRVREAIDEEVGHDVAKLAERARRIGEEYRRKNGFKSAELPDAAISRGGQQTL